MKRPVLCQVRIEIREYMSERNPKIVDALKQVWVDDGESAAQVLDQHYRNLSDPYGTTYSACYIEEVEEIGR